MDRIRKGILLLASPLLGVLLSILLPVSWSHALTLEGLPVDSSGYILSEDHIVNGDVIVDGGTLDVNGYTLRISGNLTIMNTNGRLKMVKAADVVEVSGNVTLQGAASDGYLTAGILKIGGDFYQNGSYHQPNSIPDGSENYSNNRFSFAASGTHKVIFNGTSPQTITFDRPSIPILESHFRNLEIDNSAGFILNSDIAVTGEAKWVQGAITGNGLKLYVHTDSTVVNWAGDVGSSAGWTLQTAETIISGNLTISGSTVDLNGHSLTVSGDVSVDGSLVYIDGGILTISGNLSIVSRNGRLKMVHPADVVEVSGDATFNGAASDGYLAAGVLRVGGDFSQFGSYNETNSSGNENADYSNNTHSFFASGTHRVVLNGSVAQAVHFDRPSTSLPYSHFQNLEINNSSTEGITLSTDIAAAGEAKWILGSIIGDWQKLYVHNDSVVVNWPGDVGASAGWTLQSDETVINGNLATTGNTVDLNGRSLTINGDVDADGTLIDVNGGALTVSGTFLIRGTNGRLKMANLADVVDVSGDVTFNGAASDGYLTAGVLRVGGDFSQFGSYNETNSSGNENADYSNNTHSFFASGTHRVVLNGSVAQAVHFDRPSTSLPYSHFQNLEISNSSTEGITLSTDIAAVGEAKWIQGTIAGVDRRLYVHNDSTVVNWPGDVGASAGWTLQSEETVINGNLATTANIVDLNGQSLTINGNVVADGTLIDINGGVLTILGNFSIINTNGRLEMVDPGDVVEVTGDMTFNGAASDGYLTAGVLRVGGDFSQFGSYNETNSSGNENANYANNTFSFYASGTHKTVLNGVDAQTVHFDRPSPTYSHFQDMETANTSAEGINFSPNNQITYTGTYYVQGKDPVLGGDPEVWGDLLNMGNFGSFAVPTFADLDDDGDPDMFVGNSDGAIWHYENLMANPRQGKIGLGKNFTAANLAIVPDAPHLRLGGVFTIEFWMKMDNAWRSGLIGKSNSGANGRNYAVSTTQDNRLQFSYHNAAGENINTETQPDAIDIDQWHHVAVILDNPGNAMKIYIDGVAQAGGTAGGVPVTNDSPIRIGKQVDGAESEFFGGVLDEIRISDIVRYQVDFTPPAEPFVTDVNTVALWHFDEFGSLSIVDASGRGHDGIWTPWMLETRTYADVHVGNHSAPTFADIDADGDQDLFVGSYTGQIWLFENTGSSYAPVWAEGMQLKDETYQLIFPGIHSSPKLVDIDADGALDLFIGYFNQPENKGAIAYYRNAGTPSSPVWQWVTNTHADLSYGGSLMNLCFTDMERDGDYDLVLGTSDGTLSLYRNVGTSESPTWALLPVYPYNDVDVYDVSAPVSVDIDADGRRDLVLGNSGGYIYMMQSESDQRIIIDQNRGVALDEAVILSLNGEGMEVAGYYISNAATLPAADDPEWVGVDPVTTFFTEEVSHTLETGDGLKTVYLWFKADSGSTYNMAYDTILLDKRDTTRGLLDAAAPVDFNQPIVGQLQDAAEIRYYSFLPGDWQKLMLRLDSDVSGENYRLGVFHYKSDIDEYFFSESYLGSTFDELIVFEKVPDKIVMKLEWIGASAPSGDYRLQVDTAATMAAGDKLWEFAAGGIVIASAAVSGNRVFIGSDDHKLYSLDAKTGSRLWEFQTGSIVRTSPVVSGGKVYFGGVDGFLYCLDAITGDQLWSFQTPGAIFATPAVSDGKVYTGSHDGKIYCLDAYTGEELWAYQTYAAMYSSPAVIGGKLYTGLDNGKLSCLDAQSGDQLWEFQAGSYIQSSPAVSNGKVYIGSHDTRLYCLDSETGGKLWEYETTSAITSSPSVADGKVLFGSHSGMFYSLDAETGDLLWEFQAQGAIVWSSPAVSKGKVYFGSHDTKVYCLDAKTGTKLWEYQTAGAIEASATIGDGRLYIGSHDTRLYALDAGDPDANDWLMYRHDLQHTGDTAHFKTDLLYGYIQAEEISEFNEYDLQLVEVYEDSDIHVSSEVQYSVSDTQIATIDGSTLTASNNGRVIISTDYDGKHYERTLFLMVSPDDWEGWDNDTKEKADPLPPDEFWQGDMVSGTGDDVDYYRFVLSQDTVIDLGFLAEGNVSDTNLTLMDASDGILATILSENGGNQRLSFGLVAGTYYIEATPAGDVEQDSYYYIVYTLVETMGPNDPITIEPDQTKSGTVYSLAEPTDFQLQLVETKSLDVMFTPTSLSADYRIELLDSGDTVIAFLIIENGISGRISVALAPGGYTLRVAGIETVDAGHPFTISLTPSQMLYEIEPNDTYPQGTGLGEDISMKGFLADGDIDFYAFRLDAPRYMKLDFVTDTPGTEYSLVLYKNDDQNPIDSTVCRKGSSALIEVGLTAGDYYLKVVPVGVMDLQPAYTITLAQSGNTTLEIESNNTILFANAFDNSQPKQGRIYADTDLDYFGFYVPEEVLVEISFSSESAVADYTVNITNGAETGVYQKASVDGATVELARKLPAGNYFVKITPGTDVDPNAFYHLSTTTTLLTGLKTLAGISLDTESEQVGVGGNLQISSMGNYSDATQAPISGVAWSSSDEDVALVDQSGMVSGVANGYVTIYASLEGQVEQIQLTVGVGEKPDYQTWGNLILVAGGGIEITNTLKESTQYLSDMTYSRFIGRAFEKEDIYYFNPMPWHDIDGDGFGDHIVSDETPTVGELRWAIEEWAAEEPSVGPLYIVLIDHGGIDTFEIMPGEIISAAALYASINAFESATGRQVIVIIEACKSGSFVDDLMGPGSSRMVITSTDEGNAYLELKGRISFTQFFMDSLLGGDTFQKSYLKTKNRLANSGRPYSLMNPQMAEGIDFTLSQERLGGNFAIAGLLPEIVAQTQDFSAQAQTTHEFNVTVSDLTGKTKVWAVVETPDYRPPAVVGDLEAPEVQLPTFDLIDEESGVIDGVFKGSYSDFTYNGQYRMVFYARNADDMVTISPPTIISVTGGLDFVTDPGDVNGDGSVSLNDALAALQAALGIAPSSPVYPAADVNGDDKIGLAEVIFVLRHVAGL